MIIKPVMDRSLIESVLFHPVIFDSISEDDAPRIAPEGRYVGGFVDDVCIGLVAVDVISRHVADVHIQVIPEYRETHAVDFAESVIRWFWSNGFSKLVAQIPFCCENVKRFAERVGFEVEGVNRKSWMKHGVKWDSWYLGLVRAD